MSSFCFKVYRSAKAARVDVEAASCPNRDGNKSRRLQFHKRKRQTNPDYCRNGEIITRWKEEAAVLHKAAYPDEVMSGLVCGSGTGSCSGELGHSSWKG